MGRQSLSKRLVRRLNRIANERPALGLRLAGLVGFLFGPWLGEAWWPSAAELEELLGEVDARTLRRLQRRIAAGELRNRAVMYVLHHAGPDKLAPLVRVRGAEAFQSLRDEKLPVAVVFWHLGVVRAVETALVSLGHPILCAINRPPPGPDPGFRWLLAADPASGSRFLMEALKEAERGGVPVLALDGPGPASGRVPFLGRSLPIPAGAAFLARRSGARLVPATSRWIGLSPRIEVALHKPLPAPARDAMAPDVWEYEMVAVAAQWFAGHISGHPEDLRPVSIRHALEHLRARTRAPSDSDFARLAEEFDTADGE
jgi:KDO2-lipid IV(A) lauroyltransferase